MTDREIRKLSRKLNKGHYLVSFSIPVYALFSLAVFCVLPYFGLSLFKLFKIKLDGISTYLFPSLCTVIMLTVTFAFMMIFSSVSMGEKAWYSGRLTRKKQCGKRLRFWFVPKHAFRAMRLQLLLFLIKLLWTVALLSPAALAAAGIISLAYTGGVEIYLFLSLAGGGLLLLTAGLIFRFIIIQRYFLAPYLMAQNPKLKPIQAVRQSKNLLDGHVFRIIRFKLKYFPSFLLYPLIFPSIFFYPDYKQGCSLIAKEIVL